MWSVFAGNLPCILRVRGSAVTHIHASILMMYLWNAWTFIYAVVHWCGDVFWWFGLLSINWRFAKLMETMRGLFWLIGHSWRVLTVDHLRWSSALLRIRFFRGATSNLSAGKVLRPVQTSGNSFKRKVARKSSHRLVKILKSIYADFL